MVTPLYCTLFSPICKHFFYKMAKFFEYFPKRQKNQPDNGKNQLPKPLKQGRKELTQGFQPKKSTDSQRGGDLHTDVTTADREAQIQPGLKAHQDKQQVTKGISPAAQGTQKAITQPQQSPQCQTAEEPQGSHPRGHHRKSRRQPPVALGS